jgi:RNA polymerase sigma-19 factor, ECF subfamily
MKSQQEEEVKKIFCKYYTYLLKFAISITKNKEDSEDIVVKAFYRFIQQYENFETHEKIKAYLFISVKNDCLNHIKQNKRHDRIKNKIANSMIEEEEFEFHESMSEITMHIFMEAQNLPKQCKDVFFLWFRNGFNGKEIGKLLKITQSTVFTQKARAIAFLKKKLNPY